VSKKVAIVQSNYIPWKGYFDLINSVDEFIFFDDMQFTRRDWRNRNQIKTSNGLKWLTIPVEVKGKRLQKISETMISDGKWNRIHWNSIVHNYSRAKFFPSYKEEFEELYLDCKERRLSEVNHRFIKFICKALNIKTKITWSSDYSIGEGKTERIIDLCKQAGATDYVSGPSGKAYLKQDLFERDGIRLTYMDYSSYPEYRQLFPPFAHQVSVIDLLFNEGPRASLCMKSF